MRQPQAWWGEFTLSEGQGMTWAFGAREYAGSITEPFPVRLVDEQATQKG